MVANSKNADPQLVDMVPGCLLGPCGIAVGQVGHRIGFEIPENTTSWPGSDQNLASSFFRSRFVENPTFFPRCGNEFNTPSCWSNLNQEACNNYNNTLENNNYNNTLENNNDNDISSSLNGSNNLSEPLLYYNSSCWYILITYILFS